MIALTKQDADRAIVVPYGELIKVRVVLRQPGGSFGVSRRTNHVGRKRSNQAHMEATLRRLQCRIKLRVEYRHHDSQLSLTLRIDSEAASKAQTSVDDGAGERGRASAMTIY